MTQDAPPTRAEVERRWRALIAGTATREETHAWAKPWVEDNWSALEPVVEGALQTLHGFDMIHPPENRNLLRHGGHDEGRPYYHSDRHVERELDRWLARLAEHDADPEEFRRLAHAFASLSAATSNPTEADRASSKPTSSASPGQPTAEP